MQRQIILVKRLRVCPGVFAPDFFAQPDCRFIAQTLKQQRSRHRHALPSQPGQQHGDACAKFRGQQIYRIAQRNHDGEMQHIPRKQQEQAK
ncbi:MAG: hypothetical protein POG74_01680 [Acidocella sp.]|nr:hypothetical protein [Acidocella sp.]